MSHFSQITLKIKDAEAIKLAFQELYGIDPSLWETFEQPRRLEGWGNIYFLAHLILRYQHYRSSAINAKWANNDIGFIRSTDGCYNLVLTDENRDWWQRDQRKILERIGVITTERTLAAQKVRFTRETTPEGRLVVKATIYR